MNRIDEHPSLTKTIRIESYHTDMDKNLSLCMLINFILESGRLHAEQIGVGVKKMAEMNCSWIVSKMYIEIREFPKWDDVLNIETFPTKIENLLAQREYKITNQYNNTVFEAATLWMLMDIQRRRPVSLQELNQVIAPWQKTSLFENLNTKISLKDTFTPIGEHKVVFSDLDYNNHVNSSKYLQWISDCYNNGLNKQFGIRGILINYISECQLGEIVQLFISDSENKCIFVAKRQSDNRDVFAMELIK